MKPIHLNLLIVVLLLSSCAKFRLPDGIPPPTTIVVPPPTAGDSTLQDMPFHWGAAVNISLMKNNPRYNSLVQKEFASLTAENAMKFRALQPTQGAFSWSDADYLVDFAAQHNRRVHGHTLIWYKSLPTWLETYNGDSATLENIMKTHIQTVVARFKGKVTSWDVVNEAFEDDGTLRNSLWQQKLGADYIARCFEYAHQADPDALLFYNDFGHEYSSAKRTAIINMVNILKTRGVPIHGIGMQMHTRYNQSTANIAAAINAAAATGLKVHISELDIAMNPNNVPTLTYTSALAEQQAIQYRYIVNYYYHTVPAAQQFGITSWNVTDGDSWIPSTYNRPDWPLLFDNNYERKLPYYAVLEAVR